MAIDLDHLDRAGERFARRVFKHRGDPQTVTLSERELGRMLALAHQIGAATQSRTTTPKVGQRLSALLIPQAG